MTRIAVTKEILHWAMMRSGRPIDFWEKFPLLLKWLNGEVQPTFKQLEKFAAATYTPLGYFFLQFPPDEQLPIPNFRTITNQVIDQKPSANLIETVNKMEQRQCWMREYLIKQGANPLNYVNSANINEPCVTIANKIRGALGLKDTWASEQPNWDKALLELRRKIEDAGTLVFINGIVGNNTSRKLDVSEFRGLVMVDPYVPLVFVNGSDGKAAQMFTLAHELSHVFLGKSAIFDLKALQPADDVIEKKCNQVAAEFLVPEYHLRKFWLSIDVTTNPYQKIAQHFKVSEIVAAYRLLDLGIIQKSTFDEYYLEYIHDEHQKSQSGGNFYRTQNSRISRKFGIAVVCATREGNLLYRDAYNLTDLKGDTFDRYSEMIGVC
jgi:Zn-dependent peptidase ImmA (M78 family)